MNRGGPDPAATPNGVEVVSTATQRRPRFNASLNIANVERRPIAADDLAEIVDACWAGGRARSTAAFTRARARRLDYLHRGLEEWGSVGLVARDGAVLAGFLELRPLAGHPLALLYPAGETVMVNCARYHPGFGLGVRRLLFSRLLECGGWPRLPGGGPPGQLVSMLPPSAPEDEVAFYLEHGFQETAVTTGALPGYRVFALPRQPRDLGKLMLPISTAGMEQGVLHIPQNPLCHLSLWSASQMGVAARQLGVAVREWDFTAGWPLPAPVAMLAGKPIVDLDHRVLDAQEAMALLRGAA